MIEVSPGVFMTDSRAAAEALYRDLTDGWIITSQNGLIDCIEEHLKQACAEALKDAADRAVKWLRQPVDYTVSYGMIGQRMELDLRTAILAGEVNNG
jgi:hypothetical protein